MSRKSERFKPKPRPENAVILTKTSVAKSQLETAISLWFRNADPAPILVLAFNAHEILHGLGKKIGKPSQLKTWLGTMPEPFQKRWEYVWNFCKHGLKDIDDDVPHDPRQAELLINFAGQCYRHVYGKPSPLLFTFDLRFLLENPAFTDWSAVPPIEELFDSYKWAASISREEFFNLCLRLIDAGKLSIP